MYFNTFITKGNNYAFVLFLIRQTQKYCKTISNKLVIRKLRKTKVEISQILQLSM